LDRFLSYPKENDFDSMFNTSRTQNFSPAKLDDEIENVKKIFIDLGYPEFTVRQTIKQAIESTNKLRVFGPRKCPVYLRLPFIGPVCYRYDKNLSAIISKTFGAVKLRVLYKTTVPFPELVKDATPSHEKNNVIYHYKCHCDRAYVGRSHQRFHIRRDQHVTPALRRYIELSHLPFAQELDNSKDQSAIGRHLYGNLECSRNFNDAQFTVLARARNDFHLAVLEMVFIKTKDPELCRQKQYVLNSILFK
ncbi:MAG: hypothetical protein VXY56_04130, partial [Pseudomonadota bacterium]|nr:hypothetical protein [Pseudomonadota bacterium]